MKDMRVWVCYSPNVGPFHVYPERPGTNACDSAYGAHLICDWMKLVPWGPSDERRRIRWLAKAVKLYQTPKMWEGKET